MKGFGKKIVSNPVFPIVCLLIALVIFNQIFFTSMASENFIKNFFKSNTPMACVTIGTAFVIIGGGIDISLGGLFTCVNVIIVQLNMAGVNLWVAALVGLLFGIAGGAFNGLFIARLRVTPMIATFASMSVFNGIALWVQKTAGGKITKELKTLYKAAPLHIPFPLILLIIVLIVAWLIFRSPLGMKIYACGMNQKNAFASGINVYRVQFFTYVFAGFLTGIGAIAMTASINAGDPTLGGTYSMTAISACVIGGVALSGGRGTTLGAALGSIFISLLTGIIAMANIPSYYQDLSRGLVLFGALIAAALISANDLKRRTAKVRMQVETEVE